MSLLLIPLSFLLADYKSKTSNERLLGCNLWNYGDTSDYEALEYLSKIKFTDICLSKNATKNNTQIRKGKQLIQELAQSKKETAGIHITLNDELKFEVVIDILSLCKAKEMAYSIGQDDIWILIPIKRKPVISEYPIICL